MVGSVGDVSAGSSGSEERGPMVSLPRFGTERRDERERGGGAAAEGDSMIEYFVMDSPQPR